MTISLFFFLGVSFLSRSPRSPPHCLLALQAGCTAVIQRLAFAALLSPSSAFPDSVSSKLVYALVLVEQTLQEFLYDRMHGGGGSIRLSPFTSGKMQHLLIGAGYKSPKLKNSFFFSS